MKRIIITVLTITSLIGCGENQKKTNNEPIKEPKVAHQIPEGKQLLEKHCFLCHNPSTGHDERIAPPMVAIKAMYLKDGATKEQFIKEFVDFSKNPTVEKTKMKGAVKKFNIMPKQQFSEEDLTKIAAYIYDYQIEEPTWFKEHWQDTHGTPYNNSGKKLDTTETEKTPAEIGLSYALDTKKVLGKNLMGAIQKKGTLEALKFCNHQAYPLTNSMATKFNASIKRVSDKPRNPANTANEQELKVIEKYKKMVADKAEINPIVEEHNGGVQFYYPITTNSMCLQCHGKPAEQINPATLKKLSELYPADKAVGYDIDQVRGIWSIQFKKK